MPGKRVIRRLERSGVADFDEQLWPINCALLALAGFVAGIIIATSRFDGGPIWTNGYFRLALLAITVVAMLAGTAWLHRKKAIRRMQLAVLLSLLLNLGVEFLLYRTYLDLTVDTRDQTSDWIDETEIVTLPDYGRQPSEELVVEESLERPVETTTPETMTEAVERQQSQQQPTAADRPAAAEPARRAAQPSTTTIERAPSPTSAPRRSETRGGQISRQTATLQTPPQQPLPQPSATSAAPALNNRMEAAATSIDRQQNSEPQLQRRAAPPQVADSPAARTSPQAQRAERSETTPQISTASPLGSRMAAEATTPTAAAPTETVATQAPAAAISAEPATAQVARQQSTAPAATAADTSPAPPGPASAQVATSSIDRAATPARAMPSPSAAAGLQASLPRTSAPLATAPQTAQAIEQAAPATLASGEAAPLEAAPAASMTRQAQTGPTARRPDSAAGQAPIAGQQVARNELRRAATRGAAVGATGNAATSIARATGAISTAPTMAEMPASGAAVAESTSTVAHSANGQATAANRTTGGPLPTAAGQAQSAPGREASQTAGLSPSQARRAETSGQDENLASRTSTGTTGLERSVAQAGPIGASAEAIAEPGAEVRSNAPTPGLAAQVAGQSRQSAELPGTLLAQGNSAGTAMSRTPSALPGLPTGLNRAEGVESGPQIAASSGSPAAREAADAALPAGLAEADDPGPVAGGASDDALVAGMHGPAMDNVARRESGLLPVQIAAAEGPGGLSQELSPQVGLPNRRARLDSEAIHQVAERFLMSRSSTTATIDGKAFDTPSPAFNQRTPAEREATARSRGGSSGSERAVEMGLDYLARQQLPDGRWSLQNVATGGAHADQSSAGQMQADTAATGMALLCFLGAGYTHTDGKYRDAVGAGLAHLVSHQKDNGDLFNGGSKYVWFYSHGIAAIALCEAYGMTGDRVLRGPAQKALDFIVASQHPVEGGWRYSPGSGTDTSVSGWQMMALKSGELAGLKVPDKAYEGVRKWLDIAQGPSGTPSKYSYRPASNIPHQRQPSTTMTAEGLLMRLYTGWARNDPRVLAGAEFLKQHLPAIGTRTSPQRDAYYWYYATQLMFQVQGEPWNAWNERMRAVLLPTQVQQGPLAGSWDPRGQINDRWGIEAGRIYVTAMHLLMLEVYYRHLPLYQLE